MQALDSTQPAPGVRTNRRLLVLIDGPFPDHQDDRAGWIGARARGADVLVVAPALPLPGERWIIDLDARRARRAAQAFGAGSTPSPTRRCASGARSPTRTPASRSPMPLPGSTPTNSSPPWSSRRVRGSASAARAAARRPRIAAWSTLFGAPAVTGGVGLRAAGSRATRCERSLPRRAWIRPTASPMGLHDRARDGQTQTAAAAIPRAALVAAVEALEDVFELLRCDARAAVLDRQLEPAFAGTTTTATRSPGAVWLTAFPDEIAHDLRESIRVGLQHAVDGLDAEVALAEQRKVAAKVLEEVLRGRVAVDGSADPPRHSRG